MPAQGGPRPRFLLLFLLTLTAGAPPAGALGKDCSDIAAKFARAAQKQQKKRVAVVPFVDAGGRPSRDGAIVADRIVAHLLDDGRLEVIERSLLEAVMREHRLGTVGAVDPGTVKRLGKFLGVDAVVAGTTVELMGGGRVEVHARLIDVETARVLSAALAREDKEWSDFGELTVWEVGAPSVPFFPGEARAAAYHDSLNAVPAGKPAPHEDAACDPSDEVLLDARARYWALRLRDPAFSAAGLRKNPGSDIADPRIKERFFSRVRLWYDEGRIPPLGDSERLLVAKCE